MRALLILLSALALAAVAYFAFAPGAADPASSGGAVSGAAPLQAGPSDTLTAAELAAVAAGTAEGRRAAPEFAPSTVGAASPTAAAAPATTAVVKGRVLDSFGRAIPGADVQRDEHRFGRFSFSRTDPKRTVERTTTGPDGRFELPAIGGDLRLCIGADGNEWLRRSITVAADGVTDIGDVQLATGIRLAGRVVDARGNPVADARIARPTDQDGLVVTVGFDEVDEELTRSRVDGTFEVLRHPAGSWKLTATHARHPSATVDGAELGAGERREGILIEMADGVTVAGTVSGLPADRDGLVVRARPVNKESGAHAGLSFDGGGFEELGGGGGGRSVTIAADGTFEVAGLPPAEAYRVGVYDRSFGPFGGGRRSLQAEVAAGTRNVQLVHATGATLSLRVVDSVTKAPIEAFTVSAGFGWPRPRLGPDGEPLREHAGGLVRLENLWPDAPDQRLQLELEATGYNRIRRADIEVAAGALVDLGVIELTPRPTVLVRVTNAAGAPLADAHVVLAEAQEEPGGERSLGIRRSLTFEAEVDDTEGAGSAMVMPGFGREEGRTDAQGVARVNSLPGKRARVTVTAQGFAEWTSEALSLPTASGTNVDAVLSGGGVVIVTVVDGQGQRVAGARVERRPPSGAGFPEPGERDRRTRVTDGAGVARFDYVGLGAQGFRLGKNRSGGGAVFISIEGLDGGDTEGWSEVEVVEGGEHELTLVQPARATLVGSVYEDEKPLGGARVNKFEPGGLGEELAFLGGGGITTDGAGRFRMEELELGNLTIEVRHKGRAMSMRFDVQLGEGENDARFDLPVSIVEGRVIDANGAPVQGAEVKAQRAVAQQEGPQRVAVMVSAVASGDADGESVSISNVGAPDNKVLTDEEGRYSLRGVTPDVPIVIEATKRGFRDSKSEELTVAPGGVQRKVDVTLDAGGTIEVICAESGNWMAIARIVEEGEPTGQPKIEILRDGRCKLADLEPGTWNVNVRSAGPPGQGVAFQEQTATVKSKETVTLTFER